MNDLASEKLLSDLAKGLDKIFSKPEPKREVTSFCIFCAADVYDDRPFCKQCRGDE